MAYGGLSVPIHLGKGGLHTDDSPNAILPPDLIQATNVRLHQSMVEKDAGSTRFNATAISAATSGILAAIEFLPDFATKFVVCVGGDGNVYAVDSTGVVSAAIGATFANVTFGNQINFAVGGAEASGRSRKLFIFTGTNAVRVLTWTSGGGWVSANINAATDPADWTGTTQPKWGFIHRNMLVAGGNLNDPNRLYFSSTSDHEDFTTATLQVSVSPGEGEQIVMAKVYKGKIVVFKKPYGIFVVDDSDATVTNWTVTKIHGGLGAASYNAGIQVLDDFLFKNSTGSISSFAATAAFGDLEAGDTLSILRIEQYVRDNFDVGETERTHALFYPEKKLAYFTYRSTTGTADDRMLCFYISPGESPRATVITKDSPNCLFLKRDSDGIQRPCYGAADGYIYLMDQVDRNVNGSPYLGEFQLPHMDFGFANPQMAHRNKNFDFIEVRYASGGDYSLYGDVFIDGVYTETLTFPMDAEAELASDTPEPDDFMLDEDNDGDSSFLADDTLKSARVRVHGMGRTISVRFYNAGLNETFKIATAIFSFRVSGEQNTKG